MGENPLALELKNISKSFGATKALSNVFLNLEKGKILGLVGENGAGKSTLFAILSGHIQADEGTISIDGKPTRLVNPQSGLKAGIGVIHQQMSLIESMTVAENIFLSNARGFFVTKKRMIKEVLQLATTLDLTIDPDQKIHDLSQGERQQIEILKLFHRDNKILIIDEATSLLTSGEARKLFAVMEKAKGLGRAVIFVSHKFEEIMAVADDIAILERGKVVRQVPQSSLASATALAELVFSQANSPDLDKKSVTPGQIILKADQLTGKGFDDIGFQLRKGEIVTIVGAAGNGQAGLVKVLTGSVLPQAGKLTILGETWQSFFANKSWDQSLSYIPEDRKNLASCSELDLVDNFLLTTGEGFVRGGVLQRRKAEKVASSLLKDFNIQTSGLDTTAGQLSGGNLQKMVIARAFYCKPRLMVVEQPTQGLDVRATEEVWNLLLKCREQVGVLLVTSNLSEAVMLSDRIAVMKNGHIVETFSVEDQSCGELSHQINSIIHGGNGDGGFVL